MALAAGEAAFLLLVSLAPVRGLVVRELERGGAGTFGFGRIGGTPWNVTLEDVSYQALRPTNLKRLKARRCSARVRLLPLLRHGRLAFHRLGLEDAEVEIRLDGGGPEQIALPLDADEVDLVGSSLRVGNLGGWTATFTGVEGAFTPSPSGGLALSFKCQGAAAGSLRLGRLSGHARIGQGRLDVPDFAATLYGGSLEGRGTLALDGPPVQRVELEASEVELLPALSALEGSSRFAGRADVKVSVDGRFTPSLRDLSGRGVATFRGLSVRADLPPNLFHLAPVLQALRVVRGLSGSAPFRLAGDLVELEAVALDAPDLHVSGHGTVSLGGRLDVDCRALLGGRLAQGVPGLVRSSLKRTESGDLVAPFKLSHTLAEPGLDLHEVVKGALLRPWKQVF